MSAAGRQARIFYEQVAKEGHAFTFLVDDNFLVFRIRDYDVIPFWSSRSRLERIQKSHPKYATYALSEIPLNRFLDTTLALLERDSVNVGVNWSGQHLTGYDLPVADLRRNVGYYLDKVRNEA